ncbi:MAG: carbon-nitrogen hydrolase family protein [Deinococcota bacterium]
MTLASCQLLDIQQNIQQTLQIILDYATQADLQGADVVCFPECYLQGYVVHKKLTLQLALDLSAPDFQASLERLSSIQSTLVFGLIEVCHEKLYNTAVVVKQGELLGCYRKTKLLSGEHVFEAGSEYPIFDLGDVRFGINICYDMNFSECARAVAEQGAQLLMCPANNMMRYDVAKKLKDKHNESRCQRAVESGLYILSADVTGERNGRISYGPTALINPRGEVVAQVPLLQEDMIVQEIVV